MSENTGYKTLLRRVLIQLWDEWPKCFSYQNVSAKKKTVSKKQKLKYQLKQIMQINLIFWWLFKHFTLLQICIQNLSSSMEFHMCSIRVAEVSGPHYF